MVEELLEQRSIPYKLLGQDIVVNCINPEHEDSNPSMRIDKITGIFHCFSCGHKGNIFHAFNAPRSKLQIQRDLLLKKIEKARIESLGLEYPSDAEFFEESYRGISAKTIKEFKLFKSQSFGPNRLILPIYDITGKISAFTGRTLIDEKPKYMVRPKKASVPPFPLFARPFRSTIVLVEGPFDMLNLWDNGIDYVFCCFGTFMDDHYIKLLPILGINKVYIYFDGDEPGQRAAKKLKPRIEQVGLSVENIYTKDLDPGSLTKAQIKELHEYISNND